MTVTDKSSLEATRAGGTPAGCCSKKQSVCSSKQEEHGQPDSVTGGCNSASKTVETNKNTKGCCSSKTASTKTCGKESKPTRNGCSSSASTSGEAEKKKGCCSSKNSSAGTCGSKPDSDVSASSKRSCGGTKKASTGCCSKNSTDRKGTKLTAPELGSNFVEDIQMEIGGMTCAGCCTRIEQYLSNLSGIESVEVTLLTEKANVFYDTRKINAETIMDEIMRLGFSPSQIQKTGDDACTVRFILSSESAKEAVNFVNTVVNGDNTSVSGKGIIGAMQRRSDDDGNGDGVVSISFNPELVSAMEILTILRTHVHAQTSLMPLKQQRSVAASAKKALQKIKKDLITSAIFTFPVLLIKYVVPIFWNLDNGVSILDFISAACAAVVQLIGKPIFESAYSSIRYNMRANMDVLIALSTTLSFGVSVISLLLYLVMGSSSPLLEVSVGSNTRPIMFFETSTLLITLIMLGRLGEKSAKSTAFCSMEALVDLQPDAATVMDVAEDGSKQEHVVDIGLVRRGDILKVFSGNRIPTDGIVVSGATSVDESMITGESAAVKKVQGSLVLGGTANLHGTFTMRVTRTVYESTLSQILHLVEEAQQEKPERQRIADVVASYFTLGIIILALSVFIFWYFLGAKFGLIHNEGSFITSMKFAITTLVISCPCAISLAVPTAILVATGRGASNGVLFKGGGVMEKMHSTDVVLFDKTGTLTQGKPRVVGCTPFHAINGADNFQSASSLLGLAAALEQNSNHPIAKAIVESVDVEENLAYEVKEFTVEPGRGIRGHVTSKGCPEPMLVEMGSLSWFKELGYEKAVQSNGPNDIWKDYYLSQNSGCILVCLAINREMRAYIKLQDSPRPEAVELVQELSNAGRSVWMITGDQEGTAKAIARSIGIHESCVIAGVKPEEKMDEVSKLQEQGHIVTFVGDGVNDAPALTRADVGVAIGSGTDVAVESADVVLVHPSLLNLLNAIDLSNTTVRRIAYNFGWAFVYNIVMMPIASGMLFAVTQCSWFQIPPSLAGLSELLSSVPVILFSLLLNSWVPKYDVEDDQPVKFSSYGSTGDVLPIHSGESRKKVATESTKLL